MKTLFSRRAFLRSSLAGTAGAALASVPGISSFAEAVAPSASKIPAPARVAAIRGRDFHDMTRQALDAVGGVKAIVKPGETVFIKPNFVGAGFLGDGTFRNGECAKPDIVIATAEECLRAGAAEVIVGEGGHVRRFSWEAAVTLDGSTNLAAEARRLDASGPGRVTLACLNSDSPEWVEVPSRTTLGTIAISSLVARADRVISIPVLKTHRLTHVSLSLKNFIGTMSSDRYGWPSRRKIHTIPGGVEQTYLDVVAALKPDLALIDGSMCCEGNGPKVRPDKGRTVDMRERLGSWLLLASTDLVAADATAARIIGHDPATVKQIAMADEQGLGEMREDSIEIVGGTLDDLRVNWRHAEYLDLSAPRRQRQRQTSS